MDHFNAGPTSAIAVVVVCKDALVRAGIVSTLEAARGLSVQVAEHDSLLESEAAVHAVVRRADVVVGDYDRALACALVARRSPLHRQPRTAKTLIVSHRNGEVDVRRALEAGVQGYLPLDCAPDELIDAVRALHRGQRAIGRTAAQRIAESFDHDGLTERELEVLRLIVAGEANKLIAKRLGIALGTVKVHVRSIMGKLGARTRTEAASAALRRGLVELDGGEPRRERLACTSATAEARLVASGGRPSYGALRVLSGT